MDIPAVSSIFVKNVHNPLRFNLPNPDSDTEKQNLEYSCAKIWNQIPVKLRSISTLSCFNTKNKKHLMTQLSKVST